MKCINGIRLFLCLVLASTICSFDAFGQGLPWGDYQISQPHTFRNLTVFLIQGKDKSGVKIPLTLQEALSRKSLIVHETGDVNELQIENVSQDQDVFVQSGDIVKGGKQDRVISITFLVPPRSGRIPVNAFCVEQGRWSARAGEAVATFAVSNQQIATRELKLAVKQKNRQDEVWKEVANAQAKLGRGVNDSVAALASPSSLQLSLESSNLRDRVDQYIRALGRLIENNPNTMGFAFAVNGKLSGAEIYGSSGLFRKIWLKSLKASAVEALAEPAENLKLRAPAVVEAAAFMSDAESGKVSQKPITRGFTLIVKESPTNMVFETRDSKGPNAALHRSYLRK